MKDATRLAQLVAMFILALGLSTSVQGGEAMAPIDPSVLDEFSTKGEATFWVVFKEQADLSAAFEIRDWEERGRYVFNLLVEMADSSQAGVGALLGEWGAEITPFWIANVIQVRTGHQALVSLLAARPEVSEILAPPEVELIETAPGTEQLRERTVEWNIARIRAPNVWSTLGVRGEGIVIGSIDTGVQYDHSALVGQYRGNLSGGVFDHNYNWYDPANMCGNPSNVPCDWAPDGHGTRTTGIAVGDDGGTNQIGVAPGAKFMMAAVDGSASVFLAAMQWLLAPTDLNGANPRPDLRPHVVNNSWGTSPGGNTFYQSAVQAWIASGIFPVFAIGNSGPGCNTALSPGDYQESFGVGAFDIGDNIWISSSRGLSDFGPIKPNIAAPGVDVRSSAPGDTYTTESGTSYSSPHLVGTVALMWSLDPELIGDIEATRWHLNRTAIDTSDLSCGGEPGNNNVWGEGRLDAFDAVNPLLFMDGFESGDTSAWSAVVP